MYGAKITKSSVAVGSEKENCIIYLEWKIGIICRVADKIEWRNSSCYIRLRAGPMLDIGTLLDLNLVGHMLNRRSKIFSLSETAVNVVG